MKTDQVADMAFMPFFASHKKQYTSSAVHSIRMEQTWNKNACSRHAQIRHAANIVAKIEHTKTYHH